MTITIKLKINNAAFQPDASSEVYRILKTLTERVSDGGMHYLPGNIIDSNGNTVGTVTVTGK